MTDLSDADVLRIHRGLKDKPREANKTVSILSKAMNLAERAGQRPKHSNPCYQLERYPENERIRSLSTMETKAFGEVLKAKEATSPTAVAILRLLLMTGARLSELEKLEWAWVNLDEGVIRIPAARHKTGKKTGRIRIIALGPGAVSILKKLAKGKISKWVFPADVRSTTQKPRCGHYTSTKSVWQRMRRKAKTKNETDGELRKAGLEDLHLHDLRHTFATWARQQGQSLDDVGDLLGHTDPRMTRKYAHAVVERLREQVEAVERVMIQQAGGKTRKRVNPKS
jgi:integrase